MNKRVLVLALTILMILLSVPVQTFAENEWTTFLNEGVVDMSSVLSETQYDEETEVTVLETRVIEQLTEMGYIVFDLSRGNVTITHDAYTGYLNGKEVTGRHLNTNKYYIFQGDGETDYTSIPTYSNVTYDGMDWGDFITNHPSRSTKADKRESVDEVIAAWNAADKGSRKVTNNRISITANGTNASDKTFNVTIDNIWSSYETSGAEDADEGLSIRSIGTHDPNPTDSYETYDDCAINVTVNVTVKGDNRFGRIHCATHDGQNRKYLSDKKHTNTVNFDGDVTATLTAANLQVRKNTAHTAALIGGTDGKDHSFKMTFDDITVYAGGGKLDFGTAIGGGGNGDGRVTINGGRITAVNSATGTAIGGGCGTSGPGGYGNVTINGGEVYAYAYTPYYNASGSYTDAMPTAIGGGSSGTREGGIGIVKITGGYVYAYSEVGNAIGGGGGGNGKSSSSFVSTYGGTANVTISGGTVEAVSDKGCAIGGGPGGGRLYDDSHNPKVNSNLNADGGTAKLTISGDPIIRSGSIGGGSPLDETRDYGATVGAAVVHISGGTIHGQIVMDGVIKNVTTDDESGLTNGQASSFTMTDGLIDNTHIDNKYKFVEVNGGAVYINSGSASITGGTIQNCSAPMGGAVYVKGGSFFMSGGVIQNATATQSGGAIYVTSDGERKGDVRITGGTIDKTSAAQYGGAVCVEGGNFLMTSGAIQNCEATKDGGAVYVNGGQVTIGELDCINHFHPVLSGNKAVNGGAIAVSKGNPVVHCGNLNGNTATANGGAVYVGDGSVTVNNGSMIGNIANANGGAVYISGGKFTMTGGTMNSNSANNGGAAYVTGAGASMEITNCTLSGNTAMNNGGAAYVDGGTFAINNGTVNNNRAINGGAAYVTDGNFIFNSFSVDSGNMNDNTAIGNGGAAYVYGGTFTFNNGTMSNNTAANGGAAYVAGTGTVNGNFVLNDGMISGNSASNNGGAVYIADGQFDMFGGSADTNTAQKGGAVYVTGGNFNMISGSMINNGTQRTENADGTVTTHSLTQYGGAVYVDGGDITVGVKDCGGENKSGNHTNDHTDKTHPIIQNNNGEFGGAFAVSGSNEASGEAISGVVNIFCGNITNNHANNQGTGNNIYLEGGGLVHYKESATVGTDTNHEIVTVGGSLTVAGVTGTVMIKLIYDPNASEIEINWEGEAPDGYTINLPYCPQDWQNTQLNNQLSFVGWSKDPLGTGDHYVESVRKESDYYPVGHPMLVDGGENKTMTFYAVWAPLNNKINYAFAVLDGSIIKGDEKVEQCEESTQIGIGSEFKNYTYQSTSYDRNIPTPVKPGYAFVGWLVYASDKTVSNWDADLVLTGSSDLTLNNIKHTDDIWNYWNGIIDRNFGEITLVAVFKPAYTNLVVSTEDWQEIDEDQSFVFLISGVPDDKEIGTTVEMTVVIRGNSSITIEMLPVGEYTITELTDWSWRYDVKEVTNNTDATQTDGVQSNQFKITLSKPDFDYSVTFTHERRWEYWLNGCGYKKRGA